MTEAGLTSADLARLTSPLELMEREWAPCRYNCPVHADVRMYVELISRGEWREAIDTIRRDLPFASVCGRICHHPCEANCRRADVDEPVAIREVKRYVSELRGAAGATVRKVEQTKAKVAIVGAGPAGMSAALELAKRGYRPTVFEKFDVAGGICATAIPKYRLPRDVLRQDIDWICAHGVEVRTGVEIGSDKTLADLQAEGFEAVLIATGLALSRMLPIPGADHERVRPVIEFLTELAFDRCPTIGRDVLVIGGGNVAMDAARSAVRLGAARVRAMCLEDEQEMPAWDWERDEAIEEGVEFIHRRGPVEVLIADGEISAVRSRGVTRVFDDDGRFAPRYDDADLRDIECDTVIMAIGQQADMGFAAGSGLELDNRSRLVWNPATHRTNLPSVFACGEIVTPPGSVVEACASGRRSAEAIDLHLTGRPVEIDDTLPPAIEAICPPAIDKVRRVERTPVAVEQPGVRRGNFGEIDHNYDESAAMREARRCMGCGSGAEVLTDKCAACLTCLRVCPFDVPVVTDVARIDSQLCQACGICAAECPANAIIARGRDVREYQTRTAEVLREMRAGGERDNAERRVIAFVCGHYASGADWAGEGEKVPGVAEIYLPSLARLSSRDMLKAFENGADAVFVVAAADDAERYPSATTRALRRVEQVRRMLGEIGIDANCVQWLEVAERDRDAIRRAMEEVVHELRENR